MKIFSEGFDSAVNHVDNHACGNGSAFGILRVSPCNLAYKTPYSLNFLGLDIFFTNIYSLIVKNLTRKISRLTMKIAKYAEKQEVLCWKTTVSLSNHFIQA